MHDHRLGVSLFLHGSFFVRNSQDNLNANLYCGNLLYCCMLIHEEGYSRNQEAPVGFTVNLQYTVSPGKKSVVIIRLADFTCPQVGKLRM